MKKLTTRVNSVNKKAKKKKPSLTWTKIRNLGLEMDGVEESTSYGTPALKVKGALFARLRPELDSLVVGMSFEEREAAIADTPDTYYLTDHYLNYPWVLVRLSQISLASIRDLLSNARRFALSKKKAPVRRRK